jgi:hypothetical protein
MLLAKWTPESSVTAKVLFRESGFLFAMVLEKSLSKNGESLLSQRRGGKCKLFS